MIPFLILLIAEMIILGNATYSGEPYKARSFVIINLIFISLFASLIINVHGLITNIGVVFYSAVVAAQAYLLLRYEKSIALKTVEISLFALFTVVTVSSTIHFFPILPGNELMGGAIILLTSHSFQIIFASFFAFIIGQLTLIESYARLPLENKVTRIITAMILAQIVDSLIFFPIAFYDTVNLSQVIFSGIILKAILALVFTPVILLNLKNN